MDIPQEISEKIASYIRRPNKDEDILVTIYGNTPPVTMPLDMLMGRMRRIRYKESVIQRHARYLRQKWAKGERNLRLY